MTAAQTIRATLIAVLSLLSSIVIPRALAQLALDPISVTYTAAGVAGVAFLILRLASDFSRSSSMLSSQAEALADERAENARLRDIIARQDDEILEIRGELAAAQAQLRIVQGDPPS